MSGSSLPESDSGDSSLNTTLNATEVQPLPKEELTTTTTTTTSAPRRTTTKRPRRSSTDTKGKKSKGDQGSPKDSSNEGGIAEEAKAKLSNSVDDVVAYVRTHPKQSVAFSVLTCFVFLLLLKLCCCRAPAFVVSPEEIQPLNRGKKRQQYGTNELP
ncbi:hypothetical protein STCU_10878 [Strigomonas culicis]|uniref:Uncharacterized protein n=1 Tax=Strigomonas culicis TaxID=28005 RepID=S9TJE2_9TRYP|nr:hypothetical protein STCU_10878 [Strigomonas culicis]|eukprot:EPY16974.1 hypothetical protein STCU_10878 [Strigomonas culicis]